ncbi:hypothetical protein [Tautonia sociabilis]|uniref:Uncharacterized protein n=1 Tax=Tautonia sociabilis TaxID=2080755 RepID=A0A432MDQ7_9BACT|nr:hypothetical protein [Tautonia sociabilis]RUL83073.1 hypothetical protein TsocGM_22795 [Tautonia sociabilis]
MRHEHEHEHLEFVRLVMAMHTARPESFRTRSDAALERSKSLEKRVDAPLKAALNGQGPRFGLGTPD